MFNLSLDNWNVELTEGSIKNVGPTNKGATGKLFDVESVDVREFGDKRLKLAFDDDEGNEVEVALFPEQAAEVRRGIEMLEEESRVFE
ncbi:hypothetical protein [Halorarius halobius]|uniref:hypothetical protein n=1 Tax=Halorarius halobius TaxID=2962671 RepID=UPI0020CFB808|nr:hypothetical protein [Halorarius halobius]